MTGHFQSYLGHFQSYFFIACHNYVQYESASMTENKRELGPVNFLRVFMVKSHVGRLCITHQSRGVNAQPLLYVWLLVQYMWYVSTYMGWKNYFPRTYVRDIFHLRMCDYLFTKILCTYLLFVHTWGVYVHMYLFSLFVLMDLVHQFLIIIIFQFFYSNRSASSLSIRQPLNEIVGNLDLQLQYLGNLVQQSGNCNTREYPLGAQSIG